MRQESTGRGASAVAPPSPRRREKRPTHWMSAPLDETQGVAAEGLSPAQTATEILSDAFPDTAADGDGAQRIAAEGLSPAQTATEILSDTSPDTAADGEQKGRRKLVALVTGLAFLAVCQRKILSALLEYFAPELNVLFVSVAALLTLAGYWAIFYRAGQNGWDIWVPFLSTYTLFKIAWGKGRHLSWPMMILFFLGYSFDAAAVVYTGGWGSAGWVFFVPMALPWFFGIRISVWLGLYLIFPQFLVDLMLMMGLACLHVITMHKLAASFEKDFRYTLGLIFLGPLYAMGLGFGKNDYIGPM